MNKSIYSVDNKYWLFITYNNYLHYNLNVIHKMALWNVITYLGLNVIRIKI